jgi:hypothetical protein
MKPIRDLALGVIIAAFLVAGPTAAVAASPEASVTGVSPTSVEAGQLVTVAGTNLQSTQGVSFGTGSHAVPSSSVAVSPTGTWVRAVVPTGLATGPMNINLNTGGKQVSVGPVTILSGGVAPQPNPQPKGTTTPKTAPSFPVRIAPRIGVFSPTIGAVGTRVTIQGQYLGHLDWVKFAGARARIIVNTANKIVAVVPMHAHSGRVAVHTRGGIAKSGQPFTLKTA